MQADINSEREANMKSERETDIKSEREAESSFDGLFNLHPNDALAFGYRVNSHLRCFADSFKERIEVELDYSKSLFKLSKRLHRHVNPSRPTPLSYLSSAFQVEHQQRARHALQLAEYLHTEIQIPCQNLLQETELLMKQLEKDFRKWYKEGESVEDNYQKSLKKYVRAKEDWEEKLMNTIILNFLPGISQSQLQKSRARLEDERGDIQAMESRYLSSLASFNTFAQHYNQYIETPLNQLAAHCIKELAQESDSLRKLIVSEVNMFKNIEYDLLNISRQMEQLQPAVELDCFGKEEASHFLQPIISLYCEGPITDSRSDIDLKFPIKKSFFEETLLKIESQHFSWMLDNKHNSTLRYCLREAWKKFQGGDSEDFMPDLEECIINNRVVLNVPLDGQQQKLSRDDIFEVSFAIICSLGSFIRDIPLAEEKKREVAVSLRGHLSTHHFYRFLACLTLEQYLSFCEGKVGSTIERQHLILALRLLIEESLTAKDTFVLRLTLSILFETGSSPPLFVEPSLAELDCWNSLEVWQAIFFEGTYEEISLLPSMPKSQLKEIYLMQQKNVIFSALTTYCHNMVMMGCDITQVKKIILRFCHAYGLYDEHQKNLFRLIKDSLQSYQKAKAAELAKQAKADPGQEKPAPIRGGGQGPSLESD